MLKAPRTAAARTAPRTLRLPQLVRPRTAVAKLPPLEAEPLVAQRMRSYFELCAAQQDRPAEVPQESVDAALAQLNEVLQSAEEEYLQALHQLRRTPR